MPFAGFICDILGTPMTPEECLACAHAGGGSKGTTLCPFTPPLVRGLIESNQPRDLIGYSVTELGGCPRKVVLKERVPYWLEPRKAYWAYRGRLIHALLEAEADQGHALTEQRYYADLEGRLITGQPDLIYPEPGLLVDYKTTRQVPQPRRIGARHCVCPACASDIDAYGKRQGSRVACPACGAAYKIGTDIAIVEPDLTDPQPYPAHVQQLNAYAWLLAQHDLAITRAEVVYLDMSEPLRLVVDLWPLADTQAVLAAALARLLETGADGYPYGVQEDPDARWECRYCPVRVQCRAAMQQEARG